MKSLKLYAIVNKQKPIIKYENLIRCSDIKNLRLFKGEKIIPIEVVAKSK